MYLYNLQRLFRPAISPDRLGESLAVAEPLTVMALTTRCRLREAVAALPAAAALSSLVLCAGVSAAVAAGVTAVESIAGK